MDLTSFNLSFFQHIILIIILSFIQLLSSTGKRYFEWIHYHYSNLSLSSASYDMVRLYSVVNVMIIIFFRNDKKSNSEQYFQDGKIDLMIEVENKK